MTVSLHFPFVHMSHVNTNVMVKHTEPTYNSKMEPEARERKSNTFLTGLTCVSRLIVTAFRGVLVSSFAWQTSTLSSSTSYKSEI